MEQLLRFACFAVLLRKNLFSRFGCFERNCSTVERGMPMRIGSVSAVAACWRLRNSLELSEFTVKQLK